MIYRFYVYARIDGENGPTEQLISSELTQEDAIQVAENYDKTVKEYNKRNGREYDQSYSQIILEKYFT